MKIIRFLDENQQVHLGHDYDGESAKMIEEGRGPTEHRVRVGLLLSPIEPMAILCIGKNYADHANEMHDDLPGTSETAIPERPVLFMKNPGAVQRPGGEVVIPKICMDPPEVDYEAELGVVIGKNAKNVSEDEALDYVMGYTCVNDISARIWQKKRAGGQWVRGKSFDTFCPVGPALVTTDEIPDPQDLRVRSRVNGEVRQDGHTSKMIFNVRYLISELSKSMTLLRGTLLLTGTPSGVGAAMEPPVYLKEGDELVVEIEGIGVLKNRVVEEK